MESLDGLDGNGREHTIIASKVWSVSWPRTSFLKDKANNRYILRTKPLIANPQINNDLRLLPAILLARLANHPIFTPRSQSSDKSLLSVVMDRKPLRHRPLFASRRPRTLSSLPSSKEGRGARDLAMVRFTRVSIPKVTSQRVCLVALLGSFPVEVPPNTRRLTSLAFVGIEHGIREEEVVQVPAKVIVEPFRQYFCTSLVVLTRSIQGRRWC